MPIYSDRASARIEARFPEFVDRLASSGTVELSKTLLALHVPLMVAVLMLVYRRRKIFLVDHFVVALHYWIFLLAVLPRLATFVSKILHSMGWLDTFLPSEAFAQFAVLAWIMGYLVVALRRAYGQGWWLSLAKAIPTFGACIMAHFLYRATLFAITVWVI